MRRYVVNLTNHLIGTNRYRELFSAIKSRDKFLQYVKLDLYTGDVRNMSPETLGKIMCSFEFGDVMASKDDLSVGFAGDCEEMLRELVSLCLAYVIRDRIDDHK